MLKDSIRPKFHFTAPTNWLNDPNGLIYFDGEYHLFYQHNPHGLDWGNMSWGHAVSHDLLNWNHLPVAIHPDEMGTMFSGSAVIDWNNTAGFGRAAMVLIYTAAGGTSELSQGKLFTQCLAFSIDKGRSWQKYGGNPVLDHLPEDCEGNRDPKVFWHDATGRWIMVLYVGVAVNRRLDDKPAKIDSIYIFTSPDLKQWEFASIVPGFFECPDLFPLMIDDELDSLRWILMGANGEYLIGHFDGRTFTRESGFHRLDFGKNFFAGQTFGDMPDADRRRILIAWMRGGTYPNLPFNQQMTAPTTCTLRRTPAGLRVARWPVEELELLPGHTRHWSGAIRNGRHEIEDVANMPWDLNVNIDLDDATQAGVRIFDEVVTFSPGKLATNGGSVEIALVTKTVQLRIVFDLTSIEVFVEHGEAVISWCVPPKRSQRSMHLFAELGEARFSADIKFVDF